MSLRFPLQGQGLFQPGVSLMRRSDQKWFSLFLRYLAEASFGFGLLLCSLGLQASAVKVGSHGDALVIRHSFHVFHVIGWLGHDSLLSCVGLRSEA